MITEAIVKAALSAFESESQKWFVRQKGSVWIMDKSAEALDLEMARGAVVDASESGFELFTSKDEAELAMRDKIIRAVLAAVDRVYMGVKADA